MVEQLELEKARMMVEMRKEIRQIVEQEQSKHHQGVSQETLRTQMKHDISNY